MLIDFGGVKEEVITRKEFPMAKARKVLKDEAIAVIGYGVQGPAQGLNMRDNGFNVIVGQARQFKKDWDRAVKDGWVPGKTLFDIEEACDWDDHPDVGVRRRAEGDLAHGEEVFAAGRCVVFLAWFLDCVQRPNEGGSAGVR